MLVSAAIATLVALGFPPAAMGVVPAVDYQTVPIPKGRMTLTIPLNTFLTTDWLDIRVKIKRPFQMGRYEVSNRQWAVCVAAGGCDKPLDLQPGETLDHPVVRVNWHDAHQFANWLSTSTGKPYRLPTEHEWFYVASLGEGYRADSKTFDYSDLANIKKIPKRTYPVGNFGENDWGAADMVGNVWEWTLSCHALAEESLLHPDPPAALNRPDACFTRLTGGEHRAHVPDFIRDTYNGGCSTLKPAANLGFRLVLEEP